jgi:hypothetical protein
MREFFYNLLQELDKLTGIKQWDRVQHDEEELHKLLDVLVNTCLTFQAIPENAQKSILRQSVISDGDFIGLNAKFVYKSLAAHRDRYFKEAAHIPTKEPEGYKPVDDERRAQWLKEWNKSLEGFSQNATVSHVQELVAKLPPKEKGIYHPSTPVETANQIQERIRKAQERAIRDKYPQATESEITALLNKL